MRLKFCDTHAMGEPARIIYGGFPELQGNTMMEKKIYVDEKYPEIRTMTMYEPRGHENMFGAIVLEPCNKEADMGVIFMDTGGYLNMCGHGSMAVSTFLVEEGYVEKVEPVTNLTLDSPAGLIKSKVYVEDGKAVGVSIVNVPSFLYKEELVISTESIDELKLDISYGGNFFALVNAKDLGLSVDVENTDLLRKHSLEIRDAINKNVEIKHPTEDITTVDLVEIYEEPKCEEDCYKNVVVFGAGQVDRSPCGTGTSAKLAALVAKGELDLGEEFVYESIVGTKFIGKALEKTKVGDYEGVIPQIRGRAFIIAKGEFISNEDDPLDKGFLI